MKKKIKKKGKLLDGRWWNINKNISKTITAKYDKIKDWKIDPKGYFLIKNDYKENIIRVAFCEFKKLEKGEVHEMIIEIIGNSAIEIVNTLIDKDLISSLQHAADMGIELHKAEIALKYKINYVQDSDLLIKK